MTQAHATSTCTIYRSAAALVLLMLLLSNCRKQLTLAPVAALYNSKWAVMLLMV